MRRVARLMVFAIVCVVLLGGAGLVYLAYLQASVLVKPVHLPVVNTPDVVGVNDYRTVRFPSADGVELAAWYVPPPTIDDTPGPAIVYVHGIGSNREHWFVELPLLYEAGYGGLLLDLRNHGDSGGEFTTMGVREADDVRAAFAFLAEQPEVDPDRIMFVADSLGGSSALLAAAAEPDVRGVVAVSPYSSLLGVVGDRATADFRLPARPPADLVIGWANMMSGADLYAAAPIDIVPQLVDRPLWLVHGEADLTTPPASTRRLADALRAAGHDDVDVWLVPGSGHGAMRATHAPEFQRRLLAFVQRTLEATNTRD